MMAKAKPTLPGYEKFQIERDVADPNNPGDDAPFVGTGRLLGRGASTLAAPDGGLKSVDVEVVLYEHALDERGLTTFTGALTVAVVGLNDASATFRTAIFRAWHWEQVLHELSLVDGSVAFARLCRERPFGGDNPDIFTSLQICHGRLHDVETVRRNVAHALTALHEAVHDWFYRRRAIKDRARPV
jgi:hypothetical protein